MEFNYPGYPIKFIQKDRCRDDSAHLHSHIFKFFSPKTHYHYIIRAEYHQEEVFAIKFYCKKDRRSDFKYSKIVNRGDIGNIVISCLKVIPILLQEFPNASFGFVGARSYDRTGNLVEPISKTQRFIIWSEVVKKKIGQVTFSHFEFPEASGYLLLNRKSVISEAERIELMKRMFIDTYSDFPDLMF